MRIATASMFNQLNRSFHNNLRTLSRWTNMLATGKKINKPSDDVTGMMRSMDYRVSINELQQHKENINEAESNLSFADTAMSSMEDVLSRARELALQAANGTQTQQSRASIAKEIGSLRDEVFRLSGSSFKNRHIFSGFKTDTSPFGSGPGFNYQGDSGEIKVVIDGNTTMAINIPGDQVFSVGGTTHMETLDTLYNDLMANNQTGIENAITDIDSAFDQVANVRADIGARLNRLDNLKSSIENRDYTLKGFLSETVDTDIAEAVTEISKTEVALESLRQSGADILSRSLLNFLR